MKNILRFLAVAMACAVGSTSFAATAPFVQFTGTGSGLANTCSPGNAGPALVANVDLAANTSAQYQLFFQITPSSMYMDDMYMMMMMMDMGMGSSDPYYGMLYQSAMVNGPATVAGDSIALAPPGQWYTMMSSIADHTTVMAQVTTFTGPNGGGSMASTATVSWDCTTGEILATSNLGNAAGAALPAEFAAQAGLTPVIEYYDATQDHYFVTASSAEAAALDAAQVAGWTRTGNNFNSFSSAAGGASPVCRYYLPPVYGNSHFFSASPAACAAEQAMQPLAMLESANAFYIDLPDLDSGACPAGTVSVYQLSNNRADSNSRYTTDAGIKAAMIERGYVAQGYGPDKVAMCAPK